ncbi:MAG: DNA repair protein RecO [Fidelibacterota bacterium]
MIIHTPALVLRRFPYSDTSIIARIFTRETGKVSVIAKGARRKGSQLAACFQPLAHIDLLYFHKDSRDIQTVSKVELLQIWSRFSEELTTVTLALALLEITEKAMTDYDPHPDLFDDLITVIALFNEGTVQKNLLYWYYQLRLLTVMGFMPNLRDEDQPDVQSLLRQPSSYHIIATMLETRQPDVWQGLTVNPKDKKIISEFLLNQFRRHIDGLQEIRALNVLRQL